MDGIDEVMKTKTVKVSAAVIVSEGHVLAAQRTSGEYAGYWEFPGGKQEEGESARQALKREINEELGVLISTGRQICTVEYDYETFHLSMDCFICTVMEGRPEPKEGQEIKWILPDELPEVEWLPADMLIIEKVRKVI